MKFEPGCALSRSGGILRSAVAAAALVCLMAASVFAEAPLEQSVTQRGITWHFDKPHQVGQFANGDYWVLGPVVITRITPDFDGSINGWEVNPVVSGGQGFRNLEGHNFDASLVPALPYRAEGTVSIVKTTALDPPGLAVIKGAAVLTVVDAVPPGGGAEVFRPPYVGVEKPMYRVADLRTDLLPAYAPVASMPTLASVAARFGPLQMDHKSGRTGRAMRPSDNLADYQPKNTAAQNEAVLRMMMNDPLAERMPALIPLVQFGIDKLHTIYLGQKWPDGGGHQPGHLVIAAFAAVMLDSAQAKTVLQQADFFHGSRWFTRGREGRVLWGQPSAEKSYWTYIMGGGGNRSIRDPYGYIDGGKVSEGAYQVITSQSHKGEILATHLMPSLKTAWPAEELGKMVEYTDRWVTVGQWAQPDPAAPFDGNTANYGVTYGPDANNPGQPIAGSGRFPASHGAHKDAGQYRSAYVAAMWTAYRDVVAASNWKVLGRHGEAVLVTAAADGYVESRMQGLRRLRVDFAKPLDAATVNAGLVSIVGSVSGDCSGLVESVVIEEEKSLVVTLSGALPDGERFTVTIGDSLRAADGGVVDGVRQVSLAALAGDVDGSGEVTAADVLAVRERASKGLSADAARFDVDGSGEISGADMEAVQGRIGRKLQ